MNLLAQTSQPSVIVWTQLTPQEIALRITVYSALATSAVIAFFGLLKLIATQWLGLKSTWQKGVEENIKTLGQASERSSTPPSASIDAKVEEIANK